MEGDIVLGVHREVGGRECEMEMIKIYSFSKNKNIVLKIRQGGGVVHL